MLLENTSQEMLLENTAQEMLLENTAQEKKSCWRTQHWKNVTTGGDIRDDYNRKGEINHQKRKIDHRTGKIDH